jgi:serine/threonine protein kinase
VLVTDTILGGRYRLGPVIGRGGGADVHRATDLETDRPVAVKVLRTTTEHHPRRFDLEAETLGRLDHPAIVRMCDRGEHEGDPYLVLDLIDGESLAQRLERGPLPEDEVRRIGAVLADALAYAHAAGIVHRDVKPGNVLFDQADAVHLTDFGIAWVNDTTAITSSGMVIGTAAYLAPEQVTGESATAASDMYSLGLVLLEAATGERAFDGPPTEAAIARIHRDPTIPDTVSRPLAALLASMTAAEPEMRPTATAVHEVLSTNRDVADATGVIPIASDATTAIPVVAAPPPVLPAPAPIVRRERRGPLLAVLAIAGLIVLFVIGYAMGGSGDLTPPPSAFSVSPTATSTPVSAPTTAPVATAPPETRAPAPEPRKKKGKGG